MRSPLLLPESPRGTFMHETMRRVIPRPRTPGGRARTSTGMVLVAAVGAIIVAVVVPVGGYGSPARATPLRTHASTSERRAVRLVRVYRLQTNLVTAASGRVFGVVSTHSNSVVTVFRINQRGAIWRRKLSDPLAYYFSQIATLGPSVFIATNVVKRFTDAADELLRVNSSTLRVTARARLPSGAVALASGAGQLWVATANRILRVDPRSLATEAAYRLPGAAPPVGSSSITSLALGPGGLWGTLVDNVRHRFLYRLDPLTLTVRRRVALPAREAAQLLLGVVADRQSTWLELGRYIRRVAPSGQLSQSLLTPGLQGGAAQGRGLLALLYTGSSDETLVEINHRDKVIARSNVGDAGARIAVDGHAIWVLHGLGLAHWTLIHPNANR